MRKIIEIPPPQNRSVTRSVAPEPLPAEDVWLRWVKIIKFRKKSK